MDVPVPPPGSPGLFAFADGARLRTTLEHAGFTDVKVDELEFVMSEFDDGKSYFDFTMELAGPIAMLIAQLPSDKLPLVRAEIEREAAESAAGKVRLMGVTWIATGRAG